MFGANWFLRQRCSPKSSRNARRLSYLYRPMETQDARISPLAYVSPDAKIAPGAVIEPFAYVDAHTSIGAGTWIGPHAVIHTHTTIGANCKVFSGAVVGGLPQDLKFNGEESTVEIGDRTVIRECVTINRGTTDRMVTKVGSDCLLMAYCHLAHDVLVGDHVIIANSGNIAGHVTIEDWAIIEGMVGVQQFVTIGQHAFVAGGSLVRKNIPPFIKAAREPLSFVGVNSIGLRRRGFNSDQIVNIEDIYRTLYVQNANLSQALRIAETELGASEEKSTILSFIQASDKGIIRGPF